MAVMGAIRLELSDRTRMIAYEGLRRPRLSPRAAIALCGPAIIASVAYMDPGNVATNIQAGASFGYGLLWVVLLANGMAIVFQAMSAKIGIVTGRNLAELCREHFPLTIVIAMWVASEIAAMATDLAEFLGGAIGLSLLCGVPLLWGMAATGILTYAILVFARDGFRSLEMIVGAFVASIGVSYLVVLLYAPPDWHVAAAGIIPHLAGPKALTIATGIVGATVMPHAIFLHSSLMQRRVSPRDAAECRRLIRLSNREIVIALTFAGAVNVAMVLMAAALLRHGGPDIADIETAYHTLGPLLGPAAAGVFLFSLLASGLSSSIVGTMAGQTVMQGFVGFTVPIWVRRTLTMLPAFVVVALGINATSALVVSQVILSVILPVPILALIVLSRRKTLMGDFAIGPTMMGIAAALAAIIILTNGLLVAQNMR